MKTKLFLIICFFAAIPSFAVTTQTGGHSLPPDSAILKKAQAGDATAQFQLALSLFNAQKGEQAAPWMKKAAEGGVSGASWFLGLFYLNATGLSCDYYLAAQWLSATAASTHRDDMLRLFNQKKEQSFGHYLQGLKAYYVDKDYALAAEHFMQVKVADSPEGLTMLGVCLGARDNKQRDPKAAVQTLQQAAKAGSAAAKYYLSAMIESGTGTNKDDAAAVRMLREAAQGGIAYAQCKLGIRHMTGNGVKRDINEAARLFLSAERQRHLTQAAAKSLAECYRQGASVLPDLDNADRRIEQLSRHKSNGSLVAMLRTLNVER